MNWLKRNWKKILTGFVILLILAAVYIFFPMREDLSALKDRAANYNVKILRDTYGVPHIFGHTDADASQGLGPRRLSRAVPESLGCGYSSTSRKRIHAGV